MENRRLLTIIRYCALSFLIFGIITYGQDNVDMFIVSLVMLFIINNQIRFLLLNKYRWAIIVSISLECGLAYIAFKDYGGIELFYFFTAVLDGAFLLRGKFTYIANSIIIIALILISKDLSTGQIISNFAALASLYVLARYIKEEENRKTKAQELYDKLKVSEDKLRKANIDLENYANSIEELTLLRERNRISREIHDSVGHSLSTIIIQLGAMARISDKEEKVDGSVIENLRDFAIKSLQEVRDAVRDLKPQEYEKNKGIVAIEELVKNFKKLTGVEVKIILNEEQWPLDSDKSFVVYRVIQEFLSNSVRHGKATRINVFINMDDSLLTISLQDNGVGTDEIEKGVGLNSIWERISEIGGTIEYNSKRNEGFLLKVMIPLFEKVMIDNSY